MKKHLFMCATAALLLSGCSKEQQGGGTPASDSGRVEFACSPEAQVENLTRATVSLPEACVPATNLFTITVTGNGETRKCVAGDNVYSFVSGEYTAKATYGDASKEGAGACYFEGERTFTVEAESEQTVAIAAKLANSAIRLTTGEWFDKYYKDAAFVVTTSAGNSFEFAAASDVLIFVQAGTTLKLKGTATKAQTGASVEFPESVIGTTKACAQYTIAVDASQAGAGTVNISFEETLTEVDPYEYELNPEV